MPQCRCGNRPWNMRRARLLRTGYQDTSSPSPDQTPRNPAVPDSPPRLRCRLPAPPGPSAARWRGRCARARAVVAVDDQRGDAAGADLADHAPDLGHDQRRQALGGLVEDDELGCVISARPIEHLLLAAGELGAEVRRRSVRRGKVASTRSKPSRCARRGRAPPSAGSRAPSGWGTRRAFGHVGHAQARHLVRPGLRGILAEEGDAASRCARGRAASGSACSCPCRCGPAGRASGRAQWRRSTPCSTWLEPYQACRPRASSGGVHLSARGRPPAPRDCCGSPPAGRPLAITAPLTITVMRSAMRNTASMSCSTSGMAWSGAQLAAAAPACARSPRRPCRPAARRAAAPAGAVARHIAISSWRFWPWLSSPAGARARLVRPSRRPPRVPGDACCSGQRRASPATRPRAACAPARRGGSSRAR